MGTFRVFYLAIIVLMLPMFASCGRLGTVGTSGVTHVSDAVSFIRTAPSAGPVPAGEGVDGGRVTHRAVASGEGARGRRAHTVISM